MSLAINLYCGCLVNSPPRYQVENGTLLPILAGAALCNESTKIALKQKQWLMDDDGINISAVNQIWGDLTFLYWAWMNRSDDYWGVCHYRRKWNEDDLRESLASRLYVTQPVKLCENNMRKQYEAYHGVFPGYDLSIALAKAGKLPVSEKMLDDAWNQDLIYSCNMARGPKHLMNHFCELMFEMMIPVYSEAFKLCHSMSGYQRRSIAFVAERLITSVLLNADYFFGSNTVEAARWDFIE